jgi:hypothetical protein
MPTPRTILRRLSGGVQRRFRNARPGSVLILVVALLVLMALIGTAWLSTAQIDRYDTAQHSINTEIELLVDGVVNMVRSAQVADLDAGGRVRPATGSYGNYDDIATDAFLGSRVPVAMIDIAPSWVATDPSNPVDLQFRPRTTADAPPGPFVEDPAHPRRYYEGQIVHYPPGPITVATLYFVCTRTHIVVPGGLDDPNVPSISTPPPASPGYWLQIGAESTPPPTTGLPPAGQYVHAFTPVWPVVSKLNAAQKFVDLTGGTSTFPDRTFAIPTFMTFAGDDKFPALLMYSSSAFPTAGAGLQGGMVRVPAADTDGDGVADAALFRVDVGTLNGVDYYAAVRVADNGSAINFNTAMAQEFDQDFTGASAP